MAAALESLQSQFIFQRFPIHVFTAFELSEPPLDGFLLIRSERVFGVNQLLRLDNHATYRLLPSVLPQSPAPSP